MGQLSREVEAVAVAEADAEAVVGALDGTVGSAAAGVVGGGGGAVVGALVGADPPPPGALVVGLTVTGGVVGGADPPPPGAAGDVVTTGGVVVTTTGGEVVGSAGACDVAGGVVLGVAEGVVALGLGVGDPLGLTGGTTAVPETLVATGVEGVTPGLVTVAPDVGSVEVPDVDPLLLPELRVSSPLLTGDNEPDGDGALPITAVFGTPGTGNRECGLTGPPAKLKPSVAA